MKYFRLLTENPVFPIGSIFTLEARHELLNRLPPMMRTQTTWEEAHEGERGTNVTNGLITRMDVIAIMDYEFGTSGDSEARN
jgi:hypothetical protein